MSYSGFPIRSYLYVPGDDLHKIEKALATDADALVLDLEDAVAPSRKEEARSTVAQVLRSKLQKPTFVRVNASGSDHIERDLEAVAGTYLNGVRLPKAESMEEVRAVAERLDSRGHDVWVQPLIESALGLELAFAIAGCHERIMVMGLGETDLATDLGVRSEAGLLYARSRVVGASRAAGLPNPVQSVYTNARDPNGLRKSTEEGKNLGFVGRSAIHPDQIQVINEVFTPTKEEVAAAGELLDRLDSEAASGVGAFLLEDGRMVDMAMVESARLTLALARCGREGGF